MSDFYFYSCPICQQETAGQEIGNTACGNRDCSSFMRAGARLSPLPDNSHYTKLKMQPWDYIIANELNFFEGNVVKYVTRWRHKNGLDDLRKARVYIDELIRQEEAK